MAKQRNYTKLRLGLAATAVAGLGATYAAIAASSPAVDESASQPVNQTSPTQSGASAAPRSSPSVRQAQATKTKPRARTRAS